MDEFDALLTVAFSTNWEWSAARWPSLMDLLGFHPATYYQFIDIPGAPPPVAYLKSGVPDFFAYHSKDTIIIFTTLLKTESDSDGLHEEPFGEFMSSWNDFVRRTESIVGPPHYRATIYDDEYPDLEEAQARAKWVANNAEVDIAFLQEVPEAPLRIHLAILPPGDLR